MRQFSGWLGQVVAWLVILGVVAVLAAAVVVPRLAGATPFTVLTGSMRPTYPPGTLVVVKPVDTDEIKGGDVVTYQIESGKPAVVTHRIVGVGVGLDGERVFTTKGDDNDSTDREPVQPEQVRGKLWYSVPYLGYVNRLLTGSQRQTAVLAVSALLIGYSVFMLTGAARDRWRRRSGEEDPDEPGPDNSDHYDEEELHRDVSPVADTRSRPRRAGRNAVLVVGGLVGLALTYRLIKAHRGRSRT